MCFTSYFISYIMIEGIKMATLDSSCFSAHHHHHHHHHPCPNSSSSYHRFLPAISLGGAVPLPSRKLTLSPTFNTTIRRFQLLCSSSHLQELPQHTTNVKKLYVSNLPFSLSPAHIQTLFSQCGTVTDVEVIRNKNGRITGFAFVTMASAEEAQAAIRKLHSHQISGQTIKVELAKRFKKPRPPAPPADETEHKVFASNLAWKVRAGHLREFFTKSFKNPVSARVVFDSPSGRCAGYGFVSFVTKEEAEDAISSLDGKEFMGRPVRLQFSRKSVDEAGSDKDDEEQGKDDHSEVS